MYQPATVGTKRVINCPECEGTEHSVEHLFEMAEAQGGTVTAGPWYCGQCGAGIRLNVHASGEVHIEKTERRQYKEFVLLQIEATDKPIHFIVEHLRFKPRVDEEHRDYTRFWAEENTAVINLFRFAEEVPQSVGIRYLHTYADQRELDIAKETEEFGQLFR